MPAARAQPWLTEGDGGNLLLLPQTGPWPRRISQDPQLLNVSTQQHFQIKWSTQPELHLTHDEFAEPPVLSDCPGDSLLPKYVYFTTLQIVCLDPELEVTRNTFILKCRS